MVSTLTMKKVAKLLRQGKKGRHLDGGPGGVRGLYLEIESKTNAHYLLRFQLNHRTRWMGLGSARTFALPEARTRAKVERQKLADKIDPLAVRRAERAKAAAAPETLTFTQAAERYHAAHEKSWSNKKHRDAFLSTLKQYAFPRIGALDVAEIGVPHVLAVLEQKIPAHKGNSAGVFWQVRTTTASRVRNRIELTIDFASARGHRPQGAPNPASWDILQHVLPRPGDLSRVTHFRALPFLEVPRLMQQLATHEGSAAKALQFLISTATRAGEVLGAIWDEIDFEAATWLVPPSRMKSRREFRVPLSKEALALLDNLPREPNNPYLFIGSKPGAGLSETSLAAALRRVGCDATPHGFRSSFSDWAHERSTFSNHEIELSLAHSIGSDVERAYRRGDILDRRRRLMAAWSKFICTPPPAAGAVVPMRGAR